jgi:hypothetical protein
VSPRDEACSTCHRPILWAKMPNGHMHPLDPGPVPEGNIAVRHVRRGDHAFGLEGRYLRRRETAGADEDRFVSHFATCPDAARHRRVHRKRGAMP